MGKGKDTSYLDKYEQTEFSRGNVLHGKDVGRGRADGDRRVSSTAKGNSEHAVHETRNTDGDKGHSTHHHDGGIHNHGSHTDKGFGRDWGSSKGEGKPSGGLLDGLFGDDSN